MKKYTTIFLLIITINLQAQNKVDGPSFLDRTEFKAGYFGNLGSEHGLNLGMEYAWREKKKVKDRKKGQKTITKQLLFNGSLGYSTNFTSQTDNGLHTYYGIIWRRTNSKRWQFNVELNPIGYYRSFLPETFEVNGDKVSKVGFPGRGYYAPSIAFGIGRLRKEKRLSGWYLNLNYTLRTPYNAGVLDIVSLQFGYRFNFKKK